MFSSSKTKLELGSFISGVELSPNKLKNEPNLSFSNK